MKMPIQIFLRNAPIPPFSATPRKSLTQKFRPSQGFLTQANHIKIMIHAKNVFTHVTHATHVKIWPTQPTQPTHPRNPPYQQPSRFSRLYREHEIYYSFEIYFIFRGYPDLSFNTMFIFTLHRSLGHIFVIMTIVETINKLKCKKKYCPKAAVGSCSSK